MRRNLILITSLIVAVALAAIILPLEFVPQNNRVQAQAQTQANTVLADNPSTSQPHDMAKMHSKTKSQVHSGMVFFVVMLFLDNAINVYTYFAMFNLYQAELLPFVLLVRVVQL